MKSIIFLFLTFLCSNLFSQESWVKIYQAGQFPIESFYKIQNPDNSRAIFIQHITNSAIPDPDNGAVKKYSGSGEEWYDPANGFLNTKCATCIDPPYVYTQCAPVPFFMISGQDNNFMMNFQITLCANCPDAGTNISYDRGLNIQSLYFLFGCGGTIIYPNGGDVSPENDQVCYYGYTNYDNFLPTIYRSSNKGTNWIALSSIENLRHTGPYNWDNLSGGFIKINPFNSDYIFTVHRDYMMLSIDGGYNFSSINIPPLKELSFDYTDEIIYGVTQSKLYRSLNNGISWDSSSVPFSMNTLEVSPDNNNIIYAGSQAGLYRSTDKGVSWYLYNNSFIGSKDVIGLSKEINSGDTIVVSTNDFVYKVYKDFLTGVNIADNSIPESYRLEQNFPNPFNPTTKIKFSLLKSGFTSIKVYDALGREVSVLLNEFLNSGKFETEFNAADLSSGLYYYKLTSGNFSETRKMIITK